MTSEGQLIAQSFMDYLLPSSHEVPAVEIIHHCTPSPHTVLGQKGSGESGYLGAPAAIANAINDAIRPLGISINTLPINVSKLGDLIAEARATQRKLNDRRLPRPSGAAGTAGRDPQGCRAVSQRAADRGWRQPRLCICRRQADAAGVQTAVGYCRRGWPGWPSRASTRQVVGGWVDMFGYELPGAEGEAWSRLANDCLLARRKAEPHFVPLATVPLGDGARAAGVLKDGHGGGLSRRHDRHAAARRRQRRSTHADLDPFWQAADETGAVIHIHPSFDAGDVRVNDFGLANGLGRITDAAGRGGAADLRRPCREIQEREDFRADGRRRPALRARPAQAQCANHARHRRSGRGPGAIYTDTILHDARVLKFVVEMMGTERLMMGSDMPFPIGDIEPMKIVAEAGLSKAQTESINGGLAARLFRIQ